MPNDNISLAARELAASALDVAGVAEPHLAALQQVFTDPNEYHAALAFARLHLPAREAPGFVGQALWLHTVLFLQVHEAKPDAAIDLKAIAAEALVRIAIAQLHVIEPPGGDRPQ